MDFPMLIVACIFYVQATNTKLISFGSLMIALILLLSVINLIIHTAYKFNFTEQSELIRNYNNKKIEKAEFEKKLANLYGLEDENGIINYSYIPPYIGLLLDLVIVIITFTLPYSEVRLFLQFICAFRFAVMIYYMINTKKLVGTAEKYIGFKIKIELW